MVTTSKLGLLTIKQHSATRKHLFPYAQGDKSGLRKQKKGYASTLITTALISMASSKMAGTAEYGQHISQAFYPFQEWQNSTHKGNQFILLS